MEPSNKTGLHLKEKKLSRSHLTEIQIPAGSALIESKLYAQGCTWCKYAGDKCSAYQPCHFKSANHAGMWGQTQTTQSEPKWVLFMVRNKESGDSHWVFLPAGFLWGHTPSAEVRFFWLAKNTLDRMVIFSRPQTHFSQHITFSLPTKTFATACQNPFSFPFLLNTNSFLLIQRQFAVLL